MRYIAIVLMLLLSSCATNDIVSIAEREEADNSFRMDLEAAVRDGFNDDLKKVTK